MQNILLLIIIDKENIMICVGKGKIRYEIRIHLQYFDPEGIGMGIG